ncbi:MAG TPA: trypsin-like serine protease [Candidatus Limnocylindrales bacterium]
MRTLKVLTLTVTVGLGLLTAASGSVMGAGPSTTPSPPQALPTVELVGPDALQFRPSTEGSAMAFDQLLSFASKHPKDFGCPRAGATANSFEIGVVTDQGSTLLQEAAQVLPSGLTVAAFPARASIAQLTELADEVIGMGPNDIADADLIWKTEPDQINDRIVVTVRKRSDRLFSALFDRYGDLVAVRIQDGQLAADSRDNDYPPFFGGAKWQSSTSVCTTGFSWTTATGPGMLTAAHCISNGGNASWLAYPNAGTVAKSTEENWNDTYGTQYYSGQSTYRGDVALIRLTTLNSGPFIYDGAPGTSTDAGVAGMTSRRRELGDAVCINGRVTGGWCGATSNTGENVHYIDGTVARNMSEAVAAGPTCPTHGDSGAPVYVNRSDHLVDAAGIFSGSADVVLLCSTYWTDIWDAWYGLPGSIKHV